MDMPRPDPGVLEVSRLSSISANYLRDVYGSNNRVDGISKKCLPTVPRLRN